MSDFNHRFQKTWDRIPLTVRPTADHAFLYYLRALNSDISVMVQSMGGISLPQAYAIAIRAENSLIQAGKIAPRPALPIFPTIQPLIAMQIPPLTVIPAVPALPAPSSQSVRQENNFPAQSNDLQEIKGLLQTFGSEIVNLKRQQNQNYRPNTAPYLAPFQPNRPQYQQNPQGQRPFMNQRPFQPYNPNVASASKELVPTQNNLLHEPEWCFPCNLPHD